MRFALMLPLVVLLLSYQMLYHVICQVTERQTGAVILGVSSQQIDDMLRSVIRLICVCRLIVLILISVGIAGGVGGFNPPVHFFNPPSLIYSFVLGGQKINPQIALVYTVCAIIALAQFLSGHLSTILYRYSINDCGKD